MSQENVEQENVRIVREGFAAFNADEGGLEWRGDFAGRLRAPSDR
jgi:hypothetical protein